jgi:long-chain fatty acid transport protein
MLNNEWGAGVTVYGNGGMNTDYAGGEINCGQGAANVLCGSGKLGIDLMQLIVAPTIAYKLNEKNSFGLSPLLVYQRFEANGLQAFTQLSTAPGNVTNNGYDSSTGIGVRLGYMGKLSDQFTVGASYSPKIKMGKFDKYSGLFAGSGSFDIPENYTLGVAIKATPEISLALDYQRINYGGVTSIANPSTLIGGCMMGNPANCLGGSDGAGFGWSNVNVWKIGAQWQATPQWNLRAGYNRTDNPIQARDVTFNIIAPGVTTNHYTLGATYTLSTTTEVTFAYMYASENSVSGPSLYNGMFPGLNATETIRMSQNSIGVQFGWRW